MSDTALSEQLQEHERRLVELEVEAAFRRQTAEQLDEVVREQATRLQQLEHRVAELLGQLAAATHEGEVD
jgi:uncharacterized coiled-coil protein SlyX